MANKEILLVAEAVSNEKEVPKEVIFSAIEAALAMATRKRHAEEIDVRVEINQNNGDYKTFRVWHVLPDDAEIENPAAQYKVSEARIHNPKVDVGGTIEEPM